MTQITAEQQQTIQQIHNFVIRHNLRTPILVALEAGQPLAFLGGQLLWMAQPFLSLFVPNVGIQQVAELLEQPTAVQALMTQLEQA